MKSIEWSEEKNEWLKQNRKICFEDIVSLLTTDKFLDAFSHPNPGKYPNQKIFVVEREGYVYLVPCVVDKQKIFLKTIFPSRKATRDYLLKKPL